MRHRVYVVHDGWAPGGPDQLKRVADMVGLDCATCRRSVESGVGRWKCFACEALVEVHGTIAPAANGAGAPAAEDEHPEPAAKWRFDVYGLQHRLVARYEADVVRIRPSGITLYRILEGASGEGQIDLVARLQPNASLEIEGSPCAISRTAEPLISGSPHSPSRRNVE